MWLPVAAAALVLLAAVINALACREPIADPAQDGIEAEARAFSELPAEHL